MSMRKWLTVSGIVVLVMLTLAAGLALAQGPGPNERRDTERAAVAAVPGTIPIQGRLNDDAGNPLNGVYTLTFTLYEQSTGGTALCSDSYAVSVDEGLFEFSMGYCWSELNGQQVYLGVKVNDDAEMTPRQRIQPVPYALTLRPGAEISDTRSSALLQLSNRGTGTALNVIATGGDGVWASTQDADHTALYGRNDYGNAVYGLSLSRAGVVGVGEIGVEGASLAGVDVLASGTGVIRSVANSYLWVSGNGVRPFHQSDSTVVDMMTTGGARIYRGASAGNKNVMLPIAVTGPLYGQDVTITDLDIYWKAQTEFDGIAAVILRRQTGVCSTSACYDNIVYDVGGAGYSCQEGVVPDEGCVQHYDVTSGNVLTEDSGILYLTLELAFSGESTWVDIGGIRLTLAHQ